MDENKIPETGFKPATSLADILPRVEAAASALEGQMQWMTTKLEACTAQMKALREKLEMLDGQFPSQVKRLDLAISDSMAPARDKFGQPDVKPTPVEVVSVDGVKVTKKGEDDGEAEKQE